MPPTSLSAARHQNAHKSADPDAREVESDLQDTRQSPCEIRADGCRALTEAIYSEYDPNF